jgi:hypothetical protein
VGAGCELYLLDHSKAYSQNNDFNVFGKVLHFHNSPQGDFYDALKSAKTDGSSCDRQDSCNYARFVNAQREVGLRYR